MQNTINARNEKENIFDIFSNKMRVMNFFMTLTIAAMHISWNAGREDFFTVNILRNASGGAMGWFFFMSAFWYFREYDYSVAWKKLLKRMKTLLVPYIVWNFMKFMLIYGKGILKAGTFRGYEKTFLMSMIFIRFDGLEYMPINGPLWYVIRLLTYFLAAPVIYFFLRDKRLGIAALAITFLATRNGGYYCFDGWLCLFMTGAFVGLHYRGEYIRLFTKVAFRNVNKWFGIVGMITVYVLLSIAWIMFGKSGIQINVGFHYFIGYLMAAIPILLFDVPKIPVEFSGYAFAIYCGHMVIVPELNRGIGIIDRIISIGGTPWALFLLCVVCFSIIGGCKILNYISPRFEALFTGGR